MSWLLQVFYLELVLVKVCLTHLKLLNLLLSALLFLLNILTQFLLDLQFAFHCFFHHGILALCLYLLLLSLLLLILLIPEKLLLFNYHLLHLFKIFVMFKFLVQNFFFMRLLLLCEFLLVILCKLSRELLAFLEFYMHFAEIYLELFKKAVDGTSVFLLYLFYLLLKALPHFQALLFELQITITLLFQLRFE